MKKPFLHSSVKSIGLVFILAIILFSVRGVWMTANGHANPEREQQVLPIYRLSLATQLPDSHPAAMVARLYANKVKEKSKGEIEITVFNNGALGAERELVDGVKMGTVDMANVNSWVLTAFAPRWHLFVLPYIFQSEEHMYKVVNGPVGQALFKDLDALGVRGMAYQWTGFRSIMTKTQPINTPEDLSGLKIRTMPANLTMDTLNTMGAIATPMPLGEVYNALQSGNLDGWESTPDVVNVFKMNEVCPYFSFTKHFSSPTILIMSGKTWDKLSPNAQRALTEAASELQKNASDIYHTYEQSAIMKLSATGMKFNEVDTTTFYSRTKILWKSYEDVVDKQLIDDVDKLRNK